MLPSGSFRAAVCLGILVGCALLYRASAETVVEDPPQSRQDASGFSAHAARRFHYFHYYLGLFPLATQNDAPAYSRDGALLEIRDRGAQLVMEVGHWSRLGESARILAYLPEAWLKGSARDPSIRLFNTLWFAVGLVAMYLGLSAAGHPRLALVLVALVLVTPFFAYEVYYRENIFALMASVFFLVLGLQARALAGAEVGPRAFVALGAVSALPVAFAAEVRNEIAVVQVALVGMVLLAPRPRVAVRLAAVGAAIAAFVLLRAGIREHFDRSWERTAGVVRESGGHVYTGPRISGHRIWHPVFCGLGDFGGDKGYVWDDQEAYAYALPILARDYGLEIAWSGKNWTDDYYDAAQLYYVKFDEIPEYEEVVRDKVLADIAADPIWYVGILARRAARALTVTVPFHGAGWLVLPALWYVARGRRRFELSLLLVSLPLSATPLLVYSGRGATYTSVFPLIALAIVGVAALGETPPDRSPATES